MSKIKLDRIDRKILNDLQEKGRMTNVQLAERAGISAPPCLRRVRALEESGVIKGYHAEIDPSSLGYGISVWAQVGLSSQSETDLKKFEDLIKGWPLVRECYLVSGEADYVLKIVAEDWDAYQKFLTQHLTAAPNISHIKSALGIRVAKYKPGVPIDTE
jgi:DNA-binding Lrp family transcriptional regulator